MTWERFELTGTVEDYLRYKGVDWSKKERAENRAGERKEADNGTDDHGDGRRAGGLSLW